MAKDRQGFGWNKLFDALDVEAELDKELKAGDDCSLTINCNTQTFEDMASSYYDDNSTLLDVLKGGVDSISIKGKNVRYYGATLKVTYKDLPNVTDEWVKNEDNSYSYYNTKLSENLSSGKPTAEYTTELKIPKDVFDINKKPENAAAFQYYLTAPTYVTASIGFNDGAGKWKQAEAKTTKYEMSTATGKTSATAFDNGIQDNQELLLKLTYIKYSQINITVGNFRWVDADGNVIPAEPVIEGKVYHQIRTSDGAIRFLAEVDEADVATAESGNVKLTADGVDKDQPIVKAYRSILAGGKTISAAEGKVFIISSTVLNAKGSVSAEFTLDSISGALTKTVTL